MSARTDTIKHMTDNTGVRDAAEAPDAPAALAAAVDGAYAAVGTVLDLLDAALLDADAGGAARGVGGVSVADLVAVLDGMRRVVNRAGAVQAVAVAAVVDCERVVQDARVAHPIRGLRSDPDPRVRESDARAGAAVVVAAALGIGAGWARDRVEHAVRLQGPARLVLGAQRAGVLDGYRVGIVLDELATTSDEVTAQVTARLVPDLVADLGVNPGGHSAGRLRSRVRRVVAEVDPESVRKRAERARQGRCLRRWVAEPGVDGWEGTFRAEESATAWTVIDTLAARYVREGRNTSIGQARADALLDLVHARAVVTPTVHITIPALPDPTLIPTGPEAAGTTTAPTDGAATGAPDTARTGVSEGAAPVPSGAEEPPTTGSSLPTRTDVADDAGPRVLGATEATTPGCSASTGTGTDLSGGGTSLPAGTDVADDARPSHPGTREGSASSVVWLQIREHAARVWTALAALTDSTGAGLMSGGVPVGGFGPIPVVVPPGWLADRLAAAVVGRRVWVRWSHPVTGAWIDPTGDLDCAGYRPSARLVAFVTGRDGGCRFPGCGIGTRYVDLDHVIAFPTGSTTAANLIALCRRHHRIKHRPGWQVTLHPDGTVDWVDPTGRTLTTQPIDHRTPTPAAVVTPETAVAAPVGSPPPGPAGQATAERTDPGCPGTDHEDPENAPSTHDDPDDPGDPGDPGDAAYVGDGLDGFSRCEHHLEHLTASLRVGRARHPIGTLRLLRGCDYHDGTIRTPDGRRHHHHLHLTAPPSRPTDNRPKPGDPPPY